MTFIPGGSEPRREPLGPPAYTPPITPPVQYPQPHYVAPLPPKKRRVGLIVGLAVAVLVVLCGIGTIVAAATDGKTHHAAATAVASSTAPAAGAVTPAAAPTSAPSTVAQQMRAWFDQGGHDRLTALSNAMGELQRTTQAGDIQGAKQAALGLGVVVKTAQDYAPLPDPTAQKYWASALNHFAKCAQSMYVGLTATDPDSLADAVTEMTAGAEQLRLTTQRIDKLKD